MLLSFLQFFDWSNLYLCTVTQDAFDMFYEVLLYHLNLVYPIKQITVTSRDPPFVTPYVKSMLREKNSLMHKGLINEANALARRIGVAIENFNSSTFANIKGSEITPKVMWEKINSLQNKGKKDESHCKNMTADVLNKHYANISKDTQYELPIKKATAVFPTEWISEETVFFSLNSIKQTSAGPDGLPYWFLKLCSSFISQPLSFLFNLTLMTSIVPNQWKSVVITPVPKIPKPNVCADFRPISLSSILSRLFEKLLIRHFLYPNLLQKYNHLSFDDQFAFRPTGSTTSAVIAILHKVTNMLLDYSYVHLLAFDMSKAFDTVRHSTLAEKLKLLNIPDNCYNWLIDYLCDRKHATKFSNTISDMLDISASVIQGSALGPILFLINASDYTTIVDGNFLCKYADDFYLIVPASNTHTIPLEIDRLNKWAKNNNLCLNSQKTQELIIVKKGIKQISLPLPFPSIQRVTNLKVLGIHLDSHLNFNEHIKTLLIAGAQSLYALKTLREHGLKGEKLFQVCRATLISKLVYASPAWWGFCSKHDRNKMQAIVNKAIKWELYSTNKPNIEDICSQADGTLFKNIICNQSHVLHSLLPPPTTHSYSLRAGPHNCQINITTGLQDKTFIFRMIHLNYIY